MKPSIEIKPSSGINSSSTDLLLIAGAKHCCFALQDHLSNKLVSFSYYLLSDEAEYNGFFDNTELLNNHFNRVVIAYDFNESVLIPVDVYENDDIQTHLQTIYGKDVQNAIVTENLPAIDVHNVYRLPGRLSNSLRSKFVNGNSWHLYSVLLKNYRPEQPSSILVDFKTDNFSVIVFKGSKLLLTQAFSYFTPEDILYYLLKTCQQLNLSQQEVRITLSGLIEKDSAIYRELYKYFIHLEFDGLYGNVKLAEELKAHPDHYYSSISKLAACVS